ncbi:MAG: hypothetical protein NC240_11150 [Clostridium sp.]|nr:hypothetical protein [Clostridium sp.]
MDTNAAINHYDDYIIDALNLKDWCEARTFCDNLRYSYGQNFHKRISQSVKNLLLPFESLNDVKTLQGLYINERHKVLQRCIKSRDSSKTYLQVIKNTQAYIENELNKIFNSNPRNPLLITHMKELKDFLSKFESLYLTITREPKRTSYKHRVLRDSFEYNVSVTRWALDNENTLLAENRYWEQFTATHIS